MQISRPLMFLNHALHEIHFCTKRKNPERTIISYRRVVSIDLPVTGLLTFRILAIYSHSFPKILHLISVTLIALSVPWNLVSFELMLPGLEFELMLPLSKPASCEALFLQTLRWEIKRRSAKMKILICKIHDFKVGIFSFFLVCLLLIRGFVSLTRASGF